MLKNEEKKGELEVYIGRTSKVAATHLIEILKSH